MLLIPDASKDLIVHTCESTQLVLSKPGLEPEISETPKPRALNPKQYSGCYIKVGIL